MTENEEKMLQCLWLSELIRQTGINHRTIRRLLKTWPDLDSLMHAAPKSLAETVQSPPDRISRLLCSLKEKRWVDQLQGQAVEAASKGIRATFCGDVDFPVRLKEISGCPLVLYYRGGNFQKIMTETYFVTVVGTRTPTAYGQIVTERLVGDLVDNHVVIISGLARGIDAVAHRTALKKQGWTIAVVGNGPDLPYPSEHGGLLESVAQSGLVISEYPPGTPPRKQHFPARNRILSGLADAVAVMEASRDSGTMITASFAGDQGRDVYAVPGSILSPFSQGCNQLIRDGAGVLESAQDLLWRLPIGSIQTRMEQWIRSNMSESENAETCLSSGSPQENQLRLLLSGCPLTLSEIAAKLEIPIEAAAASLTLYELEGRIKCERGRYSLTEEALFCI